MRGDGQFDFGVHALEKAGELVEREALESAVAEVGHEVLRVAQDDKCRDWLCSVSNVRNVC